MCGQFWQQTFSFLVNVCRKINVFVEIFLDKNSFFFNKTENAFSPLSARTKAYYADNNNNKADLCKLSRVKSCGIDQYECQKL
jgi:hypothetical protein